MELKWLEDYIALVEHGSFSRAADARHVTQPAFSRRIRALEAWLEVSLVDRSRSATTLTSAGEVFVDQARQLIEQIYGNRDHLQEISSDQQQLLITAQHALAVAFFPRWMASLSALADDALIRVSARDLHDAVEAFISGSGDFLLCYASPSIFDQLEQDTVESLQVGADQLVPVCGCDKSGQPLFDPQADKPLRMLRHPSESFFGRLVQRECLSQLPATMELRTVYENALSEGLKAMVLQGHGIAWLPRSLISNELESGQLVLLNGTLRAVDLQVRFYRLRRTRSEVAERFWRYLQELYDQTAQIY